MSRLLFSAPQAPTPANCCAVIVIYQPDPQFFQRLQLWSTGFKHLIIISNGASSSFYSQLDQMIAALSANITLQINPENFGVAKALNQGLAYALQSKFTWVITFDQDTLIYPYLLEELTSIYSNAEEKPLILGCNYWHDALNKAFVPQDVGAACIERKTLISSGTLLWTGLIPRLGLLREDYFIDSVDHEFALRARRFGLKLWMSTRILMRQSIGNSHTFQRPALFRIPEHTALRKYYIFRNCLTTMLTYWQDEPAWCLKQCARLLLETLTIIGFEQHKLNKLYAIALGISHALLGKMAQLSPCPSRICPDASQPPN